MSVPPTIAFLMLVAGLLAVAALAASMVAARFAVPSLALFVVIGMVIGSDGLGWIVLADYALARDVAMVALALILFEGGLTTGFLEIRPVLPTAISLAFVGTVVAAAISGFAGSVLLGFSTSEGLLLGATLAATDQAAIYPLLRRSTLNRKLARILEGEAGFNNTVAVLLVVGLIEWITVPVYGVLDAAELFARTLSIGVLVGVAVGWCSQQVARRTRLETAGLYPVASLATAAIAFGLGETLGGSGFLAVYLTGLQLGAAPIPAKQTITSFHQGVGWLAQLAMFVTLGLIVFPSELRDVAVEGYVLALLALLVARPLGTFAATAGARLTRAERVILAWGGLRGAVSVVLAIFPIVAEVPRSEEMFNIVFFAVLLSTLVQGASFEPLARRLGVTSGQPALARPLAEVGTIDRLGAEVGASRPEAAGSGDAHGPS
jgi:potassium/hydrogen antiporter